MGFLARLAKAPLTTARFDARLGQIVCFVAAIAVFVLAVLKLCSLRLTERELFIGLLAAIACTLLLIVIGLLLPISVGSGSRDRTPPSR